MQNEFSTVFSTPVENSLKAVAKHENAGVENFFKLLFLYDKFAV